jgi:hypothetical protein
MERIKQLKNQFNASAYFISRFDIINVAGVVGFVYRE